MNKRYYLLILLGLGLLTRFMFFGHPDETVFDEVHFGKFVSAYYTKEFYFDIHPALGKLLIAGFAKLSDFKPEFAFAEIGEKFPNKQYMILRFLPSLASSLLPLVIFLILMELRLAPFAAFMGGLFIVFENSFLSQGRFILMDPFMLLFGFTSLLFYLKSKNNPSLAIRYWLLAGFFSGLALSIKWIALSFIALPLAIEAFSLLPIIWNQGLKFLPFARIGKLAILLFILPISVYFLVFMVDFSILTKSGTGDAFMSPGFQKTLSGSKYEKDDAVKPSNLFQKFAELNAEMYKANQRLDAEHPYSSQWYTWPLMHRPIYYWVNSSDASAEGSSRIYFFGNPIIWWASTFAIIMSFVLLIFNFKRLKESSIPLLLLGAYALNLLPFIGVKRVMFMYHYMTALIFGIMLLAYLISQQNKSRLIFGLMLGLVISTFIYFSPLTYGLDLSSKSYDNRVWFESWK